MIVGHDGFLQRFDDSGLTNMDSPWGHYSGVAFNHDGSRALVTNTSAPNTKVLEFNGEPFGEHSNRRERLPTAASVCVPRPPLSE